MALGQRASLHSLTTPVLACFKPIGPRPIRRHYEATRILLYSLPIVALCAAPCSPIPIFPVLSVCYCPSGGIISPFASCFIFYVCCSLVLEAGSASPRYIHSAKVKPISVSILINTCSNLICERLDWTSFTLLWIKASAKLKQCYQFPTATIPLREITVTVWTLLKRRTRHMVVKHHRI